ncbi:hypothetical protein N7540_011974 [Penicillium herquei]|nr:hypothetical protein N7540_011974 [Penicillium herquei]
MYTRAPPSDEQGHMPDTPHSYSDVIEIIWWFIAALDDSVVPGSGSREEQFTPEFFPLEEALEKLSFQNDRDVLQKAVSLVQS